MENNLTYVYVVETLRNGDDTYEFRATYRDESRAQQRAAEMRTLTWEADENTALGKTAPLYSSVLVTKSVLH
jgi:hypothetical protein